MNTPNKRQRIFSTAFKKEKVELLDQGKMSVMELSKVYEVSCTSIYKWKRKFSRYSKTDRVVVEKISESQKNIELLKKIAELERAVGRKQLEIDYYKTTLAIINQEAGEDLEKKHKPKL
jgi:transposase-like protein